MFYIILAMLLYTAALLFGAAAARHANTNLVTLITNSVSVLIPAIIVARLFTQKTVNTNRFGIIMAICGGIAIAVFTLSLNKSFAVNKVGIVTPIIFGGAIFLSTVASYFIFKEKVSLIEGCGLALIAAGFIVIIYARATLS